MSLRFAVAQHPRQECRALRCRHDEEKMVKFQSSLFPLLAVCLALLPAPALAKHEADHRYNVKGFVLDENEQPLADSPVTIRSGNGVIGHQKTNSQGYYNIQLHLHDNNLGKKLQVQTAVGEATIRVRFTPGNKATRRVHQANLIGGKLVENQLSRRRFPASVYVAGTTAVVAVSALIIVARQAKRRRRRKLAKVRKHKKGKR
jgi:hypothetical protein